MVGSGGHDDADLCPECNKEMLSGGVTAETPAGAVIRCCQMCKNILDAMD